MIFTERQSDVSDISIEIVLEEQGRVEAGPLFVTLSTDSSPVL